MKYKINDLSKILGITTMTLRRYEKNGYLTPERDDSDYRLYNTSDITRIAQIRLLRKCGFSHESLEKMLGNAQEAILTMAQTRLNELDAEINRMKFLRHWLKDNIQMMKTTAEIGDDFILFTCPPMRYILYSDGDRLLTEKKRLLTIQDFMYTVEEVQMIQLYRDSDLTQGRMIPRRGWAIKETDIARLHLENIVENNEFVETYPQRECIYGTVVLPTSLLSDSDLRAPYVASFLERKDQFMLQNNYVHSGDVCCFLVDTLGDHTYILVCMPAAKQ